MIPWPNPAWQRSFELAWEALRTGSIPVGAVITDPAGRIIAAGRNRRATGPHHPGSWPVRRSRTRK